MPIAPDTAASTEHDRDYHRLREAVAARLAAARGPLFETDADLDDAGEVDALYGALLGGLDPGWRQVYACSACRRFLRRYGGVVSIDEAGRAAPLLWAEEDAGPTFGAAVAALRERVRKAEVTGVVVSAEAVWGRPDAGGWRHLGGAVDAGLVYTGAVLTAGQRAAALRQDFESLGRAVASYDRKTTKAALRLLEGEQLFRGEAVLGMAKWFDGVLASLEQFGKKGKKARRRANVMWRAVAGAPAGFCHVRSSMIGTLLDDIAAGKRFADVERAFRAKMHPLQYQRPQRAPSAGNIKQAEAIVAKLETAGALERRYARLDDLELLWRGPEVGQPVMATIGKAVAGVFDHLRPGRRGAPALDGVPSKTLTWVKFRRTVLPGAGRIEIEVPERGGFYALVTAARPEAPPIIQWDAPDRRNPVTWYTYVEPKPSADWGLAVGWVPLTGICLFPHQWGPDEDRFSHQTKGALMVIEGCRPPAGGGSGLFPSFLRSEYHPVRRTMEAFQKAATVAGHDAAAACGLTVRPGQGEALRLRVHAADGEGVMAYVIDRWD